MTTLSLREYLLYVLSNLSLERLTIRSRDATLTNGSALSEGISESIAEDFSQFSAGTQSLAGGRSELSMVCCSCSPGCLSLIIFDFVDNRDRLTPLTSLSIPTCLYKNMTLKSLSEGCSCHLAWSATSASASASSEFMHKRSVKAAFPTCSILYTNTVLEHKSYPVV